MMDASKWWTALTDLPLTTDNRGELEWLQAEVRALRQMLRMEHALNEALTMALDSAIKGEIALKEEIQAMEEENR